MRINKGHLYFSERAALHLCGGLPAKPTDYASGSPIYAVRNLRPVLIKSFQEGRVTRDRFNRLMRWFDNEQGRMPKDDYASISHEHL